MIVGAVVLIASGTASISVGSVGSAGASAPSAGTAPRTSYSLLQMNLCLSGMAECFDHTEYPKVVEDAIDVIAAREPSAVTFNEACSGDIVRIAEQTRYRMRFAPVLVRGHRLPCVDPAGRGVFGNAVITKATIDDSADRAFSAQIGGGERRRWICVQTVRQVTVCTAHLSTRGSDAARAEHQRQCAELAAVVASQHAHGPVIAAGDINHRRSCAPAGVWALSDRRASQLPGRQHSYGGVNDFRRPQVQILPAAYSDHAFMLTRTRILPPLRHAPGRPFVHG
jgi:endonuclease/exonuclease/phosphatase family metal-dependent hydrolase